MITTPPKNCRRTSHLTSVAIMIHTFDCKEVTVERLPCHRCLMTMRGRWDVTRLIKTCWWNVTVTTNVTRLTAACTQYSVIELLSHKSSSLLHSSRSMFIQVICAASPRHAKFSSLTQEHYEQPYPNALVNPCATCKRRETRNV